jgi:hypothetical protein
VYSCRSLSCPIHIRRRLIHSLILNSKRNASDKLIPTTFVAGNYRSYFIQFRLFYDVDLVCIGCRSTRLGLLRTLVSWISKLFFLVVQRLLSLLIHSFQSFVGCDYWFGTDVFYGCWFKEETMKYKRTYYSGSISSFIFTDWLIVACGLQSGTRDWAMSNSNIDVSYMYQWGSRLFIQIQLILLAILKSKLWFMRRLIASRTGLIGRAYIESILIIHLL